MHIWLTQIGEAIPGTGNTIQLRTAHLAEKLAERGHTVLWWLSAFDHFKKKFLFPRDTRVAHADNIELFALKGVGYTRNITLRRFIDHRLIALKFWRLAEGMPRPDVIVASLPTHDLAYRAGQFAQRHRIPFVVDIRDRWPDVFMEQLPARFRRFVSPFFFHELSLARKTMRSANGIISISQSLLEWGLCLACRQKREADKVFYLGYRRKHYSQESESRIVSRLKDKFVVAFVGNFGSQADLDMLLTCAQRTTVKDLYFVLVGDGSQYARIKRRAAGLSNVELTGWLEDEEVSAILQMAHVGVCMAPRETDLFTNKFCMYLAHGVPVISNFTGDVRDIMHQYSVGCTIPTGDRDALLKVLEHVYADKELWQKLSDNARRLFQEQFDADAIYDSYATYIEKMARSPLQNSCACRKERLSGE